MSDISDPFGRVVTRTYDDKGLDNVAEKIRNDIKDTFLLNDIVITEGETIFIIRPTCMCTTSITQFQSDDI